MKLNYQIELKIHLGKSLFQKGKLYAHKLRDFPSFTPEVIIAKASDFQIGFTLIFNTTPYFDNGEFHCSGILQAPLSTDIFRCQRINEM